ncbi:hypothetical protein [Streptomyces mutabilis]|uniref:Uncharacterized protein n=1 Tax=Streptomyces mutabilis TaxID=67332 RepID=A0A086MR37_9ACTN|nr:hypothetical protein [Streptomyces mutabilis]KFG71355.1 hypothetical protein FM21_34210 [Streptomyces mutabilis]
MTDTSHPSGDDRPFTSGPVPLELLPFLPEDFHDGGDAGDWLAHLKPWGWTGVRDWGSEGWNLTNWPYQAVALYDSPFDICYALAIYTEGDVAVEAWATREERNASVTALALSYWSHSDRGPADAPDPDTPPAETPARFRCPYTPDDSAP